MNRKKALNRLVALAKSRPHTTTEAVEVSQLSEQIYWVLDAYERIEAAVVCLQAQEKIP